MPIITQPCEGKISEGTLQLLRARKDRVDWHVYPCESCGQSVGVLAVNGDWVLDRHWQSVVYTPHKPSSGRYLAKTRVPAKIRMAHR
jgi:hypothetical protein